MIDYAWIKKIRKGKKVIRIKREVVIGSMDREKMTINQIDSYCGTLRERISIFVREAKTFPKERKNVENRLDIFQVNRNFIEKKKGKTPAMIEGLMSEPMQWEDILKLKFYPSF